MIAANIPMLFVVFVEDADGLYSLEKTIKDIRELMIKVCAVIALQFRRSSLKIPP